MENTFEEAGNIPCLLIAAGITVAASTFYWIYRRLTREEEQRHENIWNVINSEKEKSNNLKEEFEDRCKNGYPHYCHG